jgi:hypothetical protein
MAVTILVFAAIAALDFPGVWKKRVKKDILAYVLVFIVFFAYMALVELKVNVPSVIEAVHLFVDKIGFSYRLLRSP